LNLVASFLALRDFARGDRDGLRRALGVDTADVLVLLGNSVLATAENAFEAVQAGLAQRLLIAGGRGHSTHYLQETLRSDPRYATIASDGKSEAELLGAIAREFWNLAPERLLLETASTNCGENARFTLQLLQKKGVNAGTFILMQDPTMQRRTDAGFRKVWRDAGRHGKFANDSTWVPQLIVRDGQLTFAEHVAGCWTLNRFVSLVMGELPRLRDDACGYGPMGLGHIEHVEIPEAILAAQARMARFYPEFVRPVWSGNPSETGPA
jgi:uncharacterized SAM-binding protein YcdF (DUF218 family)